MFDVVGTYEFHWRYGCKVPATYFYYKANDTSRSINKRYNVITQNTHNK